MTDMIERGRGAVADIMNRIYARGLTTTSGGNVSLRIDATTMVISASATDKGNMRAHDVAIVAMDGTNRTPELAASAETELHLEIYRHLASVDAVVHAHPPGATVFAVTGRQLNTRLVAEAYAIVGDVGWAPYALTGTNTLAGLVAGCLAEHTPCALMENHGAITTGRTLLEAFDRLEVMENLAQIQIHAETLGGCRELTPDQCRELDELMGRD